MIGWLVGWLDGYRALTSNRHSSSLNRHLDCFRYGESFTNVIHEIIVRVWVMEQDNGGGGDDIDDVGNNGLNMHDVEKVHRADLGAVPATTVRCRSYVARRNPRSCNSCKVRV